MTVTVGTAGRAAFVLGVATVFGFVAWPFLLSLAMGAILAVIFTPAYRWLRTKRIKGWQMPPSLSSGLLTLGIALVVVLPLSVALIAGVRAALKQLKALGQMQAASDSAGYVNLGERLMDLPKARELLDLLQRWFSVQPDDVLEAGQKFLGSAGGKATDVLGAALTAIPTGIGDIVVTLLAAFFLLRDGRTFVNYLRANSVFPPEETERLLQACGNMCRSVVLATMASGGIQALVFTTSAAIVGTPNISLVFIGVFLGSFVPLIGSTPVTVGVTIYHFAQGSSGAGIFLAIVSVCVALLDNIVRPWVLKGSGHLHPLLAFVAAFGGIQALGVTGVFIGPIVAGLFVVTTKMYLERGEPVSKAY